MQIQRFQIQGFRSLYDVTIAPRPLTVIVGANNSGKSNLAEAFHFLGEVHRHGLEVAVARKGGFENIAYRRMRRTKRPLSFEVEVAMPLRDVPIMRRELMRLARASGGSSAHGRLVRAWNPTIHVVHRFQMRAAGQAIGADVAVSDEMLRISLESDSVYLAEALLHRSSDGTVETSVEFFDEIEEPFSEALRRVLRGFQGDFPALYSDDVLVSTDLVTPLIGLSNPIVREVERRLSGFHLYQLSPIACRKAGAPTPNPDLDIHGGNLPAVVDHMQRRTPAVWERLTEAMRQIVPDLEAIRTGFTHDRLLTLQFAEEGAGRPWTAEEISDGTIQSLALFAAVFDQRYPLAFIEEPENAVHPWIVRAFVEACRSVPGKQIILTTHSPALIGYLSPEDVFVVWKTDGRTHLQPITELDPDAMRLWSEGRMSTFEIVDSGWVRQTVPEAFA